MINCPPIVSSIYAAVKGVLAEQTKRKVIFTKSDWKKTLCEELGKENLYEYWGGDKKCALSPFGNIRMGCEIPLDLR